MVVTLHTLSEKLQRDIIAKDMMFGDMMDAARAIELTSSSIFGTNSATELFHEEINFSLIYQILEIYTMISLSSEKIRRNVISP